MTRPAPDGHGAAGADWAACPAALRPVLLVNPLAGSGARTAEVVDAAERDGIEVVVLDRDRTLVDLARTAVVGGADCIGVAGGDGSLAEVAGVCAGAGVAFVCVPTGTYNHFAADLGLDRDDPLAALGAFGPARERTVDLGDVDGRPFLNNVSMGAYGEVAADERYRDHKVATALAHLPEVLGTRGGPPELTVVDDGGRRVERAVAVHVSNNAYDLVPRPGFGTRPSLSDGRLGVVVLARPTDRSAVRPSQWGAAVVEVLADGPVKVGVDGEVAELSPPVRCSVRSGALRVRVAVGVQGPLPSPARTGRPGRWAGRLRAALGRGFTSGR